MFERFTDRARRVLVLAQDDARALGHNFLGTEHILLGLVEEADGVAGRALSAFGLDAATVRADIGEIVGCPGGVGNPRDAEALRSIGIDLDEVITAAAETFGASRVFKAMQTPGSGKGGRPAFVPRAKKVLELALREALTLGHNYIGTEHLLLAIIREGEGVAAQILVKRTPGLAAVREAVIETLRAYPRSGT
jgi:ATP-dependent Clp protease ATP-binding subunit ClpC